MRLFTEEFFVPLLAMSVSSTVLIEAIEESNKVEYGLTAGLFSGNEDEIARLFRRNRSWRYLREQTIGRDDRSLARRTTFLRLERFGR